VCAVATPPEIEFEPGRELAELKEYLGEDYSQHDLEHHRQNMDAEFRETASEAELYRSSRGYLYDLTVFAMSRTKLPYLAALTGAVPPGSRVLDYGCGIGSDGLLLLEHGYEVAFADFDNPSTRYLRWRLERRGLRADVYDLDRDELPGGFDLAYAFDVIEHVDEPFAFLGAMERQADRVLVNLIEFDPHDYDMHRDLPIRGLLLHALRRELLLYKRHHEGRSHLVLYGSGRAPWTRRARSIATLVKGSRA
jgi:SAM-dependent methyltransferase